ncbi:MAG TPA: flagellin [Verrucomicrobiae bacterium]|nr:flagellin [Verrucomicrobiae bacterium]
MVINTNTAATNTTLYLAQSTTALQKALAELSSGSKITSPADDPAGSAVALRMTAEIDRVNAASNNIADANSYNQTQTGYLGQVGSALSQMSQLAIQSQDVTKSNTDRTQYQAEYQQLSAYLTNAATQDFNGVSLFNGASLNVTIDSEGNSFAMTGINLGANVYTTAAAGDVSTTAGAATALQNVELAINQLSADTATVGANSIRLSYTANQLSSLNQNLQAAVSTISDVDVAQESTQYAKYNILVQTGTAMLAQANAIPQIALKLLS